MLTQLDLPIANGIRLERMTPSCVDRHIFKGAYLIGLNHIIFCADEIGFKRVLTQLDLPIANGIRLKGAYSIGLTHCQRNKT